jgi:hypothetical protein
MISERFRRQTAYRVKIFEGCYDIVIHSISNDLYRTLNHELNHPLQLPAIRDLLFGYLELPAIKFGE